MNDEQRIKRLVGDASGRGLSLPDAFGKMLELLLDNRTASADELTKAVSSALDVMPKVLASSGYRTWKALAKDLTDQLLAGKFIVPVGAEGFYAVTDKVIPGVSLLVIPEAGVRVTAFTAVERVRNEEMASIILEVNALKERVRAQGRLTVHLADMFTQLSSSIESGKEPLGTGRHSVGTVFPPEEEPDTFRMCMGPCALDKPLTKENFTIYKSRGLFYWRRKCNECSLSASVKKRKSAAERTAMLETLPPLIIDGVQPSLDELAERTEMSTETIRRVWDDLAAEGRLEPRKV